MAVAGKRPCEAGNGNIFFRLALILVLGSCGWSDLQQQNSVPPPWPRQSGRMIGWGTPSCCMASAARVDGCLLNLSPHASARPSGKRGILVNHCRRLQLRGGHKRDRERDVPRAKKQGKLQIGAKSSHMRSNVQDRYAGASSGGLDDDALREKFATAIRKLEAGSAAAEDSIPSDAVSWGGSDASEWHDSDLQAEADAAPEHGRKKHEREDKVLPGVDARTSRARARGTSKDPGRGRDNMMSVPPAHEACHLLPDGTEQRLVTPDNAKTGMLVTLSARATDHELCHLSDYFSRYKGLVGELLRPWNAQALAWWVRFPGYAEDIFSTGGEDGCLLAYAPKNAVLGASLANVSAAAVAKVAAITAGVASSTRPQKPQVRQQRLDALLRNASQAGDLDLLSAAVDAGANVNTRVPELGNMTLLHEAIVKVRPLVVARLIALGASTKAADHVGAAALHHASVMGDVDNMRALLQAGASPGQTTSAGATPLHLAARNGCLDALELLLEQGAADVTNGDKMHLTPLHYAAAAGQALCSVALLRAGASVWPKSLDGLLPEDAARGQGHLSLAQGLRDIAEKRDKADVDGEESVLERLASLQDRQDSTNSPGEESETETQQDSVEASSSPVF